MGEESNSCQNALLIEFPNDPETQPDYSTVQRWLRLADEVLKESLEPKKA
jgi:hypothetical protein